MVGWTVVQILTAAAMVSILGHENIRGWTLLDSAGCCWCCRVRGGQLLRSSAKLTAFSGSEAGGCVLSTGAASVSVEARGWSGVLSSRQIHRFVEKRKFGSEFIVYVAVRVKIELRRRRRFVARELVCFVRSTCHESFVIQSK